MANPVDFEQSNIEFKAPPDMPDCGDLHAYREDDGGPVMVCFQLTEDEIMEVLQTGKVWVWQWNSGGLCPMAVSGKYPFQ